MDVFQTLLPQAVPAAQTGISDDQIDEMRRYAEALRTSSQQPVHHWLQGVSNVVGDVMSGLESNQADRMRAKQRQDYITALGGDAAGGAGATTALPADARNTAAVLRGDPISPPAAPDAGTAPPTDYYRRLAQVESGGNPNAQNGSYGGLYGTKPGEDVVALTERNRRALTQALGRPPTDDELYMGHQQGVGGYLSHLNNPDQPAWRSMRNTAEGQNKGDAWARQAIWGNMTPQMKAQFPGGVDTVPSGAFTQMWAQRWNNVNANPPRPPADIPGIPAPVPVPAATPAPPRPAPALPPMRNPAMASDGALPGAPALPADSSDGAKPGSDAVVGLNAINEAMFNIGGTKPGAPPAAPNPITEAALSGGAAPGATPTQVARVTPPVTPPAAPVAALAQPNISPQDQVTYKVINLIRAGMKPTEAITVASNMVQARQGFQATYAPNEWGQVVRTAPGQLPTIVPGQQLGPGKAVTRYGVAGYETMGPDGVPQFKPAPLPNFGGQGAPAPAAPAGGVVPTPSPTAAPPGSAPAAPWKPTAGGPPPPIPQTLDQARTYEDNMAAWKIAQTENAKANAELEAKRMPEQAAFEAQQMREKEAARIAAETSPEALAGKAKGGALTKQAEAYVTRQQTLEKQARDAQDELPQLEMLKRVIANPDFYSGIFSKQIGDIKQLADKIGMAPSQTATLMQFAKKLGSAGSLEQIREMGQQGAVRVPEMHMIEKSNFDSDNTQEANAAVVDLRARLAQRSMEMADLANKYADQHGGLIDRGYDQFIRDYYKDKPLVRDDELQNYEQLLDRKRPASTENARTGIAPLPTSLPPGFKVTPPNG